MKIFPLLLKISKDNKHKYPSKYLVIKQKQLLLGKLIYKEVAIWYIPPLSH